MIYNYAVLKLTYSQNNCKLWLSCNYEILNPLTHKFQTIGLGDLGAQHTDTRILTLICIALYYTVGKIGGH